MGCCLPPLLCSFGAPWPASHPAALPSSCCSYCSTPDGSIGAAPEACGVLEAMGDLCAWRDSREPGLEVWQGTLFAYVEPAMTPCVPLQVWITEFGYDSYGLGGSSSVRGGAAASCVALPPPLALSPQGTPVVGPYSAAEVQGMWLIRFVLAIAKAGQPATGALSALGRPACISRAHMYMLTDVESLSAGLFASSGLFTSADYGTVCGKACACRAERVDRASACAACSVLRSRAKRVGRTM